MKENKKQQKSGVDKSFVVSMVIVVIGTSLGDVLLKRGMNMIHLPSTPSPSTILYSALEILTNGWVVSGILLMITQFIAFTRALRLAPYSLVIPLRASAYIFTAFLAVYILHEHVKPMRWVAILIVLFGVVIVGVSGKRR